MNNAHDKHDYRHKCGKVGPSYLLSETRLGGEYSGKISKKFIGNFFFWGITLNCSNAGHLWQNKERRSENETELQQASSELSKLILGFKAKGNKTKEMNNSSESIPMRFFLLYIAQSWIQGWNVLDSKLAH